MNQDTATAAKPSDVRAEASVLGSIMCDRRCADIAFEMLNEVDFYNVRYRALYRIMASMHLAGRAIDEVSLCAEVERTGHGGTFDRDEIGRLLVVVPNGAHVEEYCRIVRDLAGRRVLWDIAARITTSIDGSEQTDDILGQAQVGLDALANRRLNVTDEPRDLHDLAEPIAHETLTYPPQALWGLACGIGDGLVDELTGGIAACQYWVIAARTNVGKSTFVTALARGVRICNPEAGVPLIISTEMSESAIGRQSLASAAGVSVRGVLRRDLTHNQRGNVQRVIDNRELSGVSVKYMPGASIAQLKAVAKRHRNTLGLPLMIVDLASKLKSSGGDERQQLNGITTALAALKGELNTCVIACVQLSRSVFMDADKRPGLQHLKGSGNWEEDADRVLMIHRPAYFSPDGDQRTEIIQAKDRDFGNTTSVFIQYDKTTGQFFNPNIPKFS